MRGKTDEHAVFRGMKGGFYRGRELVPWTWRVEVTFVLEWAGGSSHTHWSVSGDTSQCWGRETGFPSWADWGKEGPNWRKRRCSVLAAVRR